MARWFLSALLLLALGSPRAQSPESSLIAMLEAYGEGHAIRLELGSVDDLRSALKKTGTAWVESGPVNDRTRRRRVLTLAALDAALAASPSEWRSINELLEWACLSFRADEPSEFERTWMLSTIAFAESERQDDFLIGGQCPTSSPACNHVRHAMSRFPDDLRFKASLIFGRVELNVLTRRPLASATLLVHAKTVLYTSYAVRPPARSAGDEKRLADSLSKLRQLTTDPILGPIARLRTGIVRYELRQFEESRREIGEALRDGLHPFDQYLAHLVIGLGFDSDNRPAEAQTAFASAVAVDPGVISGALELAAHQFAQGLRSQASAVVDRAVAADPARDDPWQRPCPDCAGWTERLNNLRAGVRR